MSSIDTYNAAVPSRDKIIEPTIVFYSGDVDFCISFRFLFQDQYRMITVTELKELLSTVKEFHPDLVIVDGTVTETMQKRFEAMKHDNPHLRIMSLYASRFDNARVRDRIRNFVDAAFSKPIDLSEITESIHALVSH
jgi:DNA-binding response OmpR family regulator